MLKYVLFPVLTLMVVWKAPAQPLDALTGIKDINIIDAYDGEQGYYIFTPRMPSLQETPPVVFIHGYGALNPMIYGKWIRHLVEEGHTVIYPRYQEDLFGTSPYDFVTNTVAAIKAACNYLRKSGIANTASLYLIGHSYGGVIIANLAANWRTLDIPEPRIAFLCEPGSGPFNGGVMDTYHAIDSSVHLAIVVGDNDETVGQEFGRKVYESAVNTPNRVLLWQYACSHQDSLNISASHYEPYAIDVAFDNGIENFTSRKAARVARLDHVDIEGYWKVFDLLVAEVCLEHRRQFSPPILDKFADLGVWPDGTALCKMGLQCPAYPGSTIGK